MRYAKDGTNNTDACRKDVTREKYNSKTGSGIATLIHYAKELLNYRKEPGYFSRRYGGAQLALA